MMTLQMQIEARGETDDQVELALDEFKILLTEKVDELIEHINEEYAVKIERYIEID